MEREGLFYPPNTSIYSMLTHSTETLVCLLSSSTGGEWISAAWLSVYEAYIQAGRCSCCSHRDQPVNYGSLWSHFNLRYCSSSVALCVSIPDRHAAIIPIERRKVKFIHSSPSLSRLLAVSQSWGCVLSQKNSFNGCECHIWNHGLDSDVHLLKDNVEYHCRLLLTNVFSVLRYFFR